MSHIERAAELRGEGCNCAQAVLGAFCGDFGLDADTAKLLTAGFGNGLGDGYGACGALLGGIMVLGLRHGHNRARAKAEIMAFKEAFREKTGELACYKLRRGGTPCGELVALAVRLLEES